MANYYDTNKLTYPQLVMNQIKTIQGICSKELRDGQKIIKNLIGEQTIEGEDTRYSFLQSIDMLGSLLSPYFPKIVKETECVTSNFSSFCNLYDMELSEALEDEDFQEKVKQTFNLIIKEKDIKKEIESKKLTSEINTYFLNYKLKEGRKMFRELVKLFKDNDYLMEDVYGDSTNGSEEDSMNAIDEGEIDNE